MFSICFLFLVSPFYVYFFIFCGLIHHPPPATRHPLPATRHPSTRYPPPATRHPSPITRGKVLPYSLSLSYVRRFLRYLDQPTGGFVIFEYANGFQSTLR